MTCAQCGHEPPAGSAFCNDCGARLAIACPGCGVTPPPGSRFCNECGTPIGGPPKQAAPPIISAGHAAVPTPQSDARKIVTILFADLAGSTALHERLDPESVRSFMESYYSAMRAAIDAHGGTLVKLLGDGVMAAFGVPHVAEDDAIRAVHAGIEMQQAFRQLAREHADIDLRVAINTGEVVVSGDNTDVLGDPVNVAARLQQEAQAGDVVVGETTRRLVAAHVTLEPLGSFTLRGRAEQVKAWRVVSLERPSGVATAAFVGRSKEMGRITAIFDAAVAQPAARLAVLLGSPGLGKSRLIAEITSSLGDNATTVVAQCDAAGGKTFAPIAGALRELLGARMVESNESMDDGVALRSAVEAAIPASDAERSRIASGIAALLAGSPASPEETFFVIRRFLTGLASSRPVVLVIDDLHWAEPLLLDLVEHLVQWGSGVPLLVLVGARPELRDLRSSLVTRGGLVSDVITLGGLDAGAAMRLAASVIGASDLPATVVAKVLSTTEGNPLFVGELVRMLVDEGAIERQGDRWVVGANLAALEMPPTIHALLAARIERLRPEERTVLEHASVVGRHFSRSAVCALLGSTGSDLDARLEALRRTELIEPDTGWFLGEPVLRFHHVLIRDAAYRRLLKGKRAELHAELAEWIEAKVADTPEHDETVGRHLEQAHRLLCELGQRDQKTTVLGERAASRLAAAGRRALGGDDVPLAASLLGRAIACLDACDTARAELALDWCESLLSAGDVGQAKTAIEELSRFTRPAASGLTTTADETNVTRRLSAWHVCFAGQLTVLTSPQGLQDAARSVSAAAQQLAALGDSAGEAKAHFVHALALARLGEVGSCEAALDRALAAARGAGDRRRANTVLAIAPVAALWGPSPVTRASGRCLDVVRVLRITQGAPAVEAVALSCQGVLEALRGRTEAARRMIASAHKMVEELGITQRVLETDVSAGLVELLEGDASAAERNLRGAYEGLRELGLGIGAAQASALLARALLAQGRDAEAEALSYESELLAGDDLKAAIAWRGVRAEALARRGEHGAAVELAGTAVELAAATDALLDHADARLALAAALRAAGRRSEADAEERRARELWDAKGATLLSERAQSAVVSATPAPAISGALQPPTKMRSAITDGRRLPRNFAIQNRHRLATVIASRDVQAIETVFRQDVEIIDHPHGRSYGYASMHERIRLMIAESVDSKWSYESLTPLGESLAVCRLCITTTGSSVDTASIGATDVAYVQVVEADNMGRARRVEIFAEDKLGEALVRLYERYAGQQPEGPARASAAQVARSIAAYDGRFDPGRVEKELSTSFRLIDHRSLA
ncbi:MAG TPA: adenylate/guanylate cyclase domain-containing protein, partial [Candidatus Limnocylindrales bacterium]|nr:adenylate/guanylate cyclase domain-containing protein [Candidatus Limnocylindrales bacterium]